MKYLLIFIFVLSSSCVSGPNRSSLCNYSGNSFCLALPNGLENTGSRIATDFLLHGFYHKQENYNVLIYEGNHPDLGTSPEVLETFDQQFGEVEYSVKFIKTETASVEIVLKRKDDLRIPESIHIKTNKLKNQDSVVKEILGGFYGCKSVLSVNSICRLD